MTLGSLGPDCDGRPIFPGDRVGPAPGCEPVQEWVPDPPWTAARSSKRAGHLIIEERATDDGRPLAAPSRELRKLRPPRSGYEAADGTLEGVVRGLRGDFTHAIPRE